MTRIYLQQQVSPEQGAGFVPDIHSKSVTNDHSFFRCITFFEKGERKEMTNVKAWVVELERNEEGTHSSIAVHVAS